MVISNAPRLRSWGKQGIKAILRNDEAATAVEYAVMLAMVLMAVIGAVGLVGDQTGGMWGGIDSDLKSVGFGS